MKLVLQSNEGIIAVLSELDVAQHGTGDIGSDFQGVGCDGDSLLSLILGLNHLEVRRFSPAEEDIEVEGNALEAEHVISVGGDLDLELRGFLLPVDHGTLLVFRILVEFNAKFEAEVLELLCREPVGGYLSVMVDYW